MAKKEELGSVEGVVVSTMENKIEPKVKQYKSVLKSTIKCPLGKIAYGDIFTAKEEDVKELLEKKYVVEVKMKSMSM